MTSSYDLFVAKIIATGKDRSAAVQLLVEALAETKIVGLETNLEYLREIVASDSFRTGNYSTTTLENFEFRASAFEVLDSGLATTV